jgi:hypothetical protein
MSTTQVLLLERSCKHGGSDTRAPSIDDLWPTTRAERAVAHVACLNADFQMCLALLWTTFLVFLGPGALWPCF